MLAIVARTSALLLIGAGLGLGANALRPDGVPLRYTPPVSCEASHGAQPAVELLPPDRAAQLCGDPGVMIADARPPQRYAEGHVSDAIHLPCAAPRTQASTAVTRLESKHTLIVYGDTTEEARPVAEDLRRRIGRSDLRIIVLDGGFAAWNQAGLACSSGPCPECAEHKMKRAIGWALRVGLGGLFVVTGILKLRDPAAFATAIANYQLWPQLAAVVAAVLPAVEVVVGLAAIAAPRGWRRGAFAAMALMMVVFTAAASSALGRHIDIACGCFGTESGSITAWTIVRDVGLLAAALLALRVD